MTGAAPSPGDAEAIIARTRYLLLDFDGPVCDIFAGHTDRTVADKLRKLISAHGITPPPADVADTPDPLAVFIYSATISADVAAEVEAELTEQELTAVPTARPGPYVHDVVTSARQSGRTIAVVSNNSQRAVQAYLARHGLDDRIDLISARTSSDPGLLKPSPHLVQQAMARLAAMPAECVLVGDSVSDIQAGHQAGIATIGYANRDGKPDSLSAAGATAIITSLADLVLPLRAHPLSN